MVPDNEVFILPTIGAEPRRVSPRPHAATIEAVVGLLADTSRWVQDGDDLVFEHTSTITIQFHRAPANDQFRPNALRWHIVCWLPGGKPFRMRIEDPEQRGAMNEFIAEMAVRAIQDTITQVGVMARLAL